MKKLLLFFILVTSQLLYSQSDCISAIPVCGNSSVSYNPSSGGSVIEQTDGSCLALEHYSVWYVFTAATSGTIEFTINPNTVPGVLHYDYDFAVYGPNINCATQDFGDAIRCNFSGTSGPTGLSSTIIADFDQWELPLNVLAGETYYLLIDNYIPSNPYGFDLTWGGTATLVSAFNDSTLAPNPFLPPGTSHDGNVSICSSPSLFDFSTLSTGIINGNANFSVTYHTNSNDALTNSNPVTTPISVNTTDTYYYGIHYTDPANPTNPLNACTQTGTINFVIGPIVVNNATIKACNNNKSNTGVFNLNLAPVYADPAVTKKYYPTLADLTAGTNEITNPTAYTSTAPKQVHVKVTTTSGCSASGIITLEFYPISVVNDATIETCFIENNITHGIFNLNTAVVTSQTPVTKKYYKTLADAVSGANEILNPTLYDSTEGFAFVRVYSENGCYNIAKITLVINPPVKSTVLKDKTICLEDRTTLDAGPGFDGYEWSTGATTQTISGVPVGAYWVKLKTGKCFTLQQVNVYATQQPVIASLDITNNTITVNATGGTAPYQYSTDGITWQDSNVFNNLPRGENKIYLKDSFDCTPILVQVTVPNLVNAITPNGDNINDEVDYSALAYKKDLVFTVYNRYGNKMYESDKMRNYKWNGTSGGKKIVTGTYWYTITWTETDANSTQTKYSGWILVKNRE
ncbi:T9SS type B sorting domain-containing protein [Chryseobacterium wangxinyae]|uniref:T9SS type B sorting domain-containing protein n=1 Tax=Chryseobacterium sp. CY353 TaxID=2997334 RepID=UPI00226DBA72|nr:gliding motility-associated C-terminal domain-containing protein [Chryseobacterium sp. CY353]MCY0969596.1 gliding motility-associated C-terminal domain-containing protein [Chryseobacterium sp. CY353]